MPPYLKRKAFTSYSVRPTKKAKFVVARQTRVQQYNVPVRYAKPPNKVELKYIEGVDSEDIASTGYIVLLNGLANGTGPNQRIGSNVFLNDLHFNLSCKLQVANLPVLVGSNITVSIVYDSQTNGALPGITTIYNTVSPDALTNAATRSRFTILWEKNYAAYADATTGISGGIQKMWLNQKISMKGKKMEFDNTAAGISDIEKGSIYMVCRTNDNLKFEVQICSRLQFFD